MSFFERSFIISIDTANGVFDLDSFNEEITASSIVPGVDHINVIGDDVTVFFKADLSPTEDTVFDGLVSVHGGESAEPEPEVVQPKAAVLDSSSIRTLSSFNSIDLNKTNQGYNDVYTNTGIGSLHSFWLGFNSDNVMVRLEVDEVEIFEVDCDDLESNSLEGVMTSFGWLSWSRDKNTLLYNPAYSIKFNSSLKIQAKANSSSSGRDLNGYIIDIEVPQ